MPSTIITTTILSSLDELAKREGVSFRKRKQFFADICGIQYSAVAQWYGTGGQTKNIRVENLSKIAKHFKIPLDLIINGKIDEQLKANANLEVQLKRLKDAGLEDQGALLIENFLDALSSTK